MTLKKSIVLSVLFIISAALYEGDECTVPETKQNGKCVSISECEYAKKLLQSGNRPQNCGYTSKLPLVCCPSTAEIKLPPVGLQSVEKCKYYHDIRKQVFGIFLGVQAGVKEFPHMAAIGYGEKSNVVWLCGGSLISEKFVLTAAHCTVSKEFGSVRWVRLGDLDLKNETEGANPVDLSVSRIISHPNYHPPSHYHDIALLELEKEVFVHLLFKPACLNTEERLPFNKLQATGWGKTGFIENPSSILLKVNLDIFEYNKCKTFYSSVSQKKLPQGILDQYQICAGDFSGEGRDTCPGDSGGPLQFYQPPSEDVRGHYVIAGITSFGKGCGLGESVGIYTRVSAYIGWIESIVWPSD